MQKIFLFFIIVFLGACNNTNRHKLMPASHLNWSKVDLIEKSIKRPVFSDKIFRVAKINEDSVSYNIQEAIDKAAGVGGGTVIVPAGVYFSMPILLKSNIHLILEEGAILKFVPEPAKYPIVYTWFESLPCMNFSPMIYAKDQENIKISGEGIIDGQSNQTTWLSMTYGQSADKKALKEMQSENIDPSKRIFGLKKNLRPDLISFINCNTIEISGVTLINSPNWTLHPILCKNIRISDINISGYNSNQVGIATECCSSVLINNVNIRGMNTGIQISSIKLENSNLNPSANIIVKASKFVNNRNTISIGPTAGSGIKNIFISGNNIQKSYNGITVRNNATLEGVIQDIFIKEIYAKNIYNHFFYSRLDNCSEKNENPLLFNVHLENIQADSCGRAFHIDGDSIQPIQNFYFENTTFHSFKEPIAEDIFNLSFKNYSDDDLLYNQSFNLKDARADKFDRNDNNLEILNRNNIHKNELPTIVKEVLFKNYPLLQPSAIRQIITKTRELYEFVYFNEIFQKTVLLISNDGEILRNEQAILLELVPVNVLVSLKEILKTDPIPHIMDEIKKIVVQDFIYYEFKGEMRHQIFFVGIANDGSIIEQKQKEIAGTLPYLIKQE